MTNPTIVAKAIEAAAATKAHPAQPTLLRLGRMGTDRAGLYHSASP